MTGPMFVGSSMGTCDDLKTELDDTDETEKNKPL